MMSTTWLKLAYPMLFAITVFAIAVIAGSAVRADPFVQTLPHSRISSG